jgi:hypothetical protein
MALHIARASKGNIGVHDGYRPFASRLKSRLAGRSSNKVLTESHAPCGLRSVISKYLICPRIFHARNSILTFPNFFNTLPTAETMLNDFYTLNRLVPHILPRAG